MIKNFENFKKSESITYILQDLTDDGWISDGAYTKIDFFDTNTRFKYITLRSPLFNIDSIDEFKAQIEEIELEAETTALRINEIFPIKRCEISLTMVKSSHSNNRFGIYRIINGVFINTSPIDLDKFGEESITRYKMKSMVASIYINI